MNPEPSNEQDEFFIVGKDTGSGFTLWDVCPAPVDPARRAIMLEEAGVDVHDAMGELLTERAATAHDAVRQALGAVRERARLAYYSWSGTGSRAASAVPVPQPAAGGPYGQASLRGATKDGAFCVTATALPGVPSFTVRGLAGRSTPETRDRVRAGVINNGWHWPLCNVLVEVSPSAGAGRAVGVRGASALDLAIACAVLTASGQLSGPCLAGAAAVGELGLDGAVRVPWDLSGAVEAIAAPGTVAALVPAAGTDGAGGAGARLIGVRSLKEAADVLAGHRHHPAGCAHCCQGAAPHQPCTPSVLCTVCREDRRAW
ncbi:magnesium chelatase domain-containing protein [Streptomyces cyaneofuscatus]|uniref:magnesium chelatase domain-containing protein n=1 Tax=Streptomyces cyaneofuscatus TaxID=66883 RepID=UPI00344F0148